MPFTVIAMAGCFVSIWHRERCTVEPYRGKGRGGQGRVRIRGRTVCRGLLVRIQIASVDTTRITAAVNSGEGCGTLGRRTRQGIRDPGQGDDEAGIQRGQHEQHGEVAGEDGGSRCRRSGEDEGRDGDGQRQGDVEVAFASTIRVPGVGEGAKHGETVGRGRETEGDRAGVVEGLDDGGEKVGDGGGGDDAEDEEHEDPGLGVGEGEPGAVQEGLLLLFAVDPVVCADVVFQAPDGELLFVLGEPWRGAREVRQDEHGAKGDDDGDGAFDDEQPAPGGVSLLNMQVSPACVVNVPCAQTHLRIHVLRNASCNQARERPRDQRPRVQGSGAKAQLLPGVPGTQEVQAAREIRSLDEAQEEPDSDQTGIILGSSRAG